MAMLPGPYRVPAYRGRIRVVLTNKTPCGTYRAPGRFEGTAAREHLLDVAADQLGLDRIELRRRNLLTRDEIPHRRPIATLGTDLILDTGDYPALLAAAAGRPTASATTPWKPANRDADTASAWPCSWRRAASGRRRPRT